MFRTYCSMVAVSAGWAFVPDWVRLARVSLLRSVEYCVDGKFGLLWEARRNDPS